jgi:hemolysin III
VSRQCSESSQFGVLVLPWLAGQLGAVKVTLLLAGGVLYTVGAVVLDRQCPNPSPAVFGYHEVWHGLMSLRAFATTS